MPDGGRVRHSRRHTARECSDLCIETSACDDKDIVFVVPPFASPDWPSLGVHILAKIAESKGLATGVVYANLSFARFVGPKLYRSLCVTRTRDLIGERLFRAAYSRTRGLPGAVPSEWTEVNNSEPPDFHETQGLAREWADAFGPALANASASVVGFSSTFEQTLASFALTERIKQHAPEKTILFGGANADGPMGSAIKAFEPLIDHVFVGEADISFAHFAEGLLRKEFRSPGIVQGHNLETLDTLAPPDFETFFEQFRALVLAPDCEDGLDTGELRIPYETSRGCWWGAKHHCTFCGLNANGMTHRTKDPDKVFEEVHKISSDSGVDRVIMVDNIMPFPYFSTLLPQLAGSEKRLRIFYEQKSNISLRKMRLLAASGVTSIQPGIESLSTDLLRLMKKGVSARTNIDCMRFARACGVDIVWNVLVDFPGDTKGAYEKMIGLMPKLFHLAPPTGLSTVSIDRFSPYHASPDAYGITDMRPVQGYTELFPGGDLDALAYHFEGTYRSAARERPELMNALSEVVEDWISAWDAPHVPLLMIQELGEAKYVLVDTRPIAIDHAVILDTQQARLLLNGASSASPEVFDFLDKHQLAEIDGHCAALAFAEPGASAWGG